MASPRRRDRFQNPIKAGTVAAAGAVALILAVAALVFTNASTSEDLIDDAQVLQYSEAALGANDVALKALTQAVLLSEDELLGVADDATVEAALGEAGRTIAELEGASDALQAIIADPGAVRVATEAVLESSIEITTLIAEDDAPAAGELLSGPAKANFVALRDTFSLVRDETAARLSDAERITGILASLARYVLAFLIPGVAILAYRFMARRQLAIAEVELDARLEAEEEVVRAKDEFIANISHELRTPLTSIFGFSELLLEQGMVDPDMAAELVGLINTESSELTRLVEDLLTSARAEANSLMLQLEEVDIERELSSVMVQLNRAGSTVQADCTDEAVLGDPLRVRQILRNLLSNAQRHGGNAIRVRGRPLDASYVITVEDDGEGIPTTMEPRLFSRFIHQGEDPLTKGSIGLGLAVVKILAEGMNGTVQYERREGWTRFIVRLPLATPSAPEIHSGEITDEVA